MSITLLLRLDAYTEAHFERRRSMRKREAFNWWLRHKSPICDLPMFLRKQAY